MPHGERVEHVIVRGENRLALLQVIAGLPDEAFSYVVLACSTVRDQYAQKGGFRPESREGFTRLGQAADAYSGT